MTYHAKFVEQMKRKRQTNTGLYPNEVMYLRYLANAPAHEHRIDELLRMAETRIVDRVTQRLTQ